MEVREKYLNSQALEKDIRKGRDKKEADGGIGQMKKKSNFRYFHKCVQGQPGYGT